MPKMTMMTFFSELLRKLGNVGEDGEIMPTSVLNKYVEFGENATVWGIILSRRRI
jgi:hypothetical protein